MISLQNEFFYIEILEDCGFTVSKIKFKEHEILHFPFSYNEYKKNKELAGIPFLYPFANRLEKVEFILEEKKVFFDSEFIFKDQNGFPIHGILLKTNQWEIIEKQKNYIKSIFEFKNDWLNFFPFEHTIEYSIELFKNQIHFKLELKNFKNILPISFGFHPYFTFNDKKNDIKLFLPCRNSIKSNSKLFPIELQSINSFFDSKEGKIEYQQEQEGFLIFLNDLYSWDDGFTDFFYKNGFAKFQLFQKKYQMNLYFDQHYSVCQIYSPKNENFICIEPMVAKTNAFLTKDYIRISKPEFFLFIIEIIT